MPVAQAADLAAMTEAIFEEHDRDADREALQSLALEFQNHLSPRTAVETLQRFKWYGRHRHDPEAIISEINGVTHLFGDERELLATAASQLQKRRLNGRFAIADTLGAAWALANTAPSQKDRSRKNGFEFFIAPPGQTLTALQTLPPAALRLPPDTVATLSRLGVETVGSLLRLPREGLATRLGRPLCDRIAQATGEIDEPLIALETPSDHSASLVLEYPTDAMDLISDRLERLIDQAIVDLQPLHRGVLRLRCHLDFTAHPPAVLESGLFAPTLDRSHLTRLMLGALQAHRLGSMVTQMTICVAQHAPLSSRQPSIFGPDFQSGGGDDWTRQSEAARLIDVLSGRLGEDCVRGVRLSDDPLPESSVEDFPMTTHRMRGRKVTGGRVTGGGPPRTTDLGRRPIELLEVPSPITPIDAGGREADTAACDHFPAAFRIRGSSQAVHRHWGPERIETRWWSGPLIRRDYFRVELVDGSRLWVYHDLVATGEQKRWFLHGRFA
ncbi:hypothetical protein Pla100_46110 [Neorhodopirellula pilleata]|uniref:DNA polymerase IV n=2 Tax=Neorhodopirellula pilleata TaxID=2714738 RepID=A0A5C6A273_9BACT|nr:hypothetical protein Pla100_46110 [Neorhodopirellula pilleata]